MCELPFTFNQKELLTHFLLMRAFGAILQIPRKRGRFAGRFTSYFLHHYEPLISGFGNCGMIQLINACGERVCI